MTDREQAEILIRAAEADTFDEIGTRWRLVRQAGPNPREDLIAAIEDDALREVERFLGEEVKSETYWYLYCRWKPWRDFETRRLGSSSLWALKAVDEAFNRRRFRRLERRAALRRERRRK